MDPTRETAGIGKVIWLIGLLLLDFASNDVLSGIADS